MSNHNVGILFVGVKGICQAFKDIFCNVLWANENDKNSSNTYKPNHLDAKLIEADAGDLTKDDVESIDILTAGFPCQHFSQAGHGRGFEDDRGKVFFDLIRLMQELHPKAYLLENVKCS